MELQRAQQRLSSSQRVLLTCSLVTGLAWAMSDRLRPFLQQFHPSAPAGRRRGRFRLRPAAPGRPQPHEARWGRRHQPALAASDLRDGHAGLFDRAFFINSDGATERRSFMERQLESSGVPFERWPALRGSPSMLETHASYLERGVERHLHVNRSNTTPINGWGTVGTYLSHHTLFEHLVERYEHDDNASVLILQDDTELRAGWLQQLRSELTGLPADWERVLLVWWGLARESDCGPRWCVVRPPAGPTDHNNGAECCNKRFFHGLQAWLVRVRNLRCVLRRLRRRKIKNIDALIVTCNCPHQFALQPRVSRLIGMHLDREMGSERAEVNAAWRVALRPNATRRPPAKPPGPKGHHRRRQGPRLAGKRAAPQPASQQCLVVHGAHDSGSPTCEPWCKERHCGRWCKCQACEYCST